jgi:hypothetical protein
MGYLDQDLESGYALRQSIYDGMQRGHEKRRMEALMGLRRAEDAANPSGFGMGASQVQHTNAAHEGQVYSMGEDVLRADMDAGQNARDWGNWASGRQLQHERNLQNNESMTRQISAQQPSMVAAQEAAATGQVANAIGGMGNGFQMAQGMPGLAQGNLSIHDQQGNRIGGTYQPQQGALSGLIRRRR